MLEPQNFRDVLVIARARSLKAAAAALAIDPSTMGRRLESIESRFGASLFIRTARGLELTPEGTSVASAAEKMGSIRLDFEGELLAREQQRANALVLTAAEWVSSCSRRCSSSWPSSTRSSSSDFGSRTARST